MKHWGSKILILTGLGLLGLSCQTSKKQVDKVAQTSSSLQTLSSEDGNSTLPKPGDNKALDIAVKEATAKTVTSPDST